MNASRRRPSAIGGLGVLLSTTFPALAADPQSLPPVVVTATRAPQPVANVLADMRVIDADTVSNAGAMTLTELLQVHGGVEIAANGGPGQTSSVFIRGSNANHVVVLVDGVRINSATAGLNAFENLPLAQIDHIEILRGPGSSLYGADAIGGVIQIFTKGAGQDHTEARIGAGRWATREASAGIARHFGATRLSVQLGTLSSRPFSATNAANFSFNPDDDPYRNSNLGLDLEHDWADGQTLAARLLTSRGTTHFDNGPDSDDLNRQRLGSVALESRNRLSAEWRSLVRIARGSDHSTTEGSFGGIFNTDQDQVTWQNDIGALGGQVVAGIDWRREKVHSDTSFTVTSRSNRAVFAGYSASVDDVLAEASLRYDDNSQFGSHATGKLGLGYRLTPQWRVSASAGTAFKAPDFNFLYYPGFSNPDLQPERSRSVEAAARYDGGSTQAGLTVFNNRVCDLIATIDETFIPYNVKRARIRGVTLDGALRQGIWQARAELTHQEAEDADTGTRLARRAKQLGSASLSAADGPWRAGVEWVASGARFNSAANSDTSRMGGYALVNLTAGWALTPQWSLSARLNNLADKRYELVQGYNTPARNLFVALAYSAL